MATTLPIPNRAVSRLGIINLVVMGREDAADDTRCSLAGRDISMRKTLMAALAASGAPGAIALAQQTVPAPTAVEGVVITAQKPAQATSIDRRTYSVAHDLQASAGSVGDVLRNLPSVEVDVLGNLSLRGDSNVQVLIDGKPSTMMSAANRGAILQQMPADSIESIEVITNPSAQFKPDGASGIINIVTKKNRRPGRSGTAQASLGTEGRYNLGATAAYKSGALNLFGSASLRHETRKRTTTDHRVRRDAVAGGAAASDQTVVSDQQRDSKIVSAGFDYDLGAKSRISGSASYNRRAEALTIGERNRAADPGGAVLKDYDRQGAGRGHETSTQLSAGYRRTLANDGEFTLDLQRGETKEDRRRTYLSRFRAPPAADLREELIPRADEITTELSAEYSGALPGKAKLKLGYDLQSDNDDYDNYGGTIVDALHVADPSQTNRFLYKRTVHALYGTYERPLGDWTLLAGLRLEETLIDTHQVTSALKNSTDYFRAYPTLHLEKDLGEDQKLRFSYSKRVARPEPEDLNPYFVVIDAFSARAGNPNLMPQETHAFEVGYETRIHGATLAATAYARRSLNGMTEVSRYISPTVLLTTKENLGKATSGSVELSASGKIASAVSYNLSTNVFYNQIDAANLGFAAKRSTIGYTGKASLDYAATAKDFFQVSASYSGKRLTAQGRRLPSSSVNLGYRRKLTSDLSAVVTVSDLLNRQRDRTVIDTPTLSDQFERRQLGRTAFVSLSWKFGAGGKAKDPGFDYGAP